MKKAKLALTFVALMAVAGGALAFKASRIQRTFFAYTTILVGGKVTGACIPAINVFYEPNANGPFIINVSSTSVASVATCTCRVVQVL